MQTTASISWMSYKKGVYILRHLILLSTGANHGLYILDVIQKGSLYAKAPHPTGAGHGLYILDVKLNKKGVNIRHLILLVRDTASISWMSSFTKRESIGTSSYWCGTQPLYPGCQALQEGSQYAPHPTGAGHGLYILDVKLYKKGVNRHLILLVRDTASISWMSSFTRKCQYT